MIVGSLKLVIMWYLSKGIRTRSKNADSQEAIFLI